MILKPLIVYIALITSTGCFNRVWDVSHDVGYNKRDHREVFRQKCIVCHGSYNLDDPYQLVKMGLIKPGAPEESKIYRVLKGVNLESNHQAMPVNYDWSEEETQSIYRWIKNFDQYSASDSSGVSIKKKLDFLSDKELYRRCFSLLVRKRSLYDSHILRKVENNEISGPQACMLIINELSFNQDGVVQSEIGRAVLETLYGLHQGWYNEYNLFRDDEAWGGFEVFNPASLSLFWLDLLKNNLPVSHVLLGTHDYEELRESLNDNDRLVSYSIATGAESDKMSDYKFAYGMKSKNKIYHWSPTTVPRGELIGFKRRTYKENDFIPGIVNGRIGQIEIHDLIMRKKSEPIHQGQGGGIIGSEVYLQLNTGADLGKTFDGGLRLPRKWSQTVISDFFCRKLPVVKASDVELYVNKKSSISFQTNKACMHCHATMDHMAGLIRNIEYNYSIDRGRELNNLQTTHFYVHKTNQALSESIISESDPSYHLRPKTGRFIYTDLAGNHYDAKVQSLDELGKIIGQIDDFYHCLASRYFEFFTGLQIEPAIIYLKNKNEKEQFLSDQLAGLSNHLKTTQSLREAYRFLFQSELFRERSFYINQDESSVSKDY